MLDRAVPPSGTPSRCWPTPTASPPRPRGLGKEIRCASPEPARTGRSSQLKAGAGQRPSSAARRAISTPTASPTPTVDWRRVRQAVSSVSTSAASTRCAVHHPDFEHYDNLAALFDAHRRASTPYSSTSDRDMWHLYLDGVFQAAHQGRRGRFEQPCPTRSTRSTSRTAEGNLGHRQRDSYDHLAGKLPVSRLQRDLTRLHRAAQCRRSGGPHAAGRRFADEGAGQGDSQRGGAAPRSGRQRGRRGRRHPDRPAPCGLSLALRSAQSALRASNTRITAEAIAAFIAGGSTSRKRSRPSCAPSPPPATRASTSDG